MSLVDHIKAAFLAVAADIKQLKAQVALAGGLWAVTASDPPDPQIGAPWLLEKVVNPEAPVGVLLAGFGSDMLFEPITAVNGYALSVKTSGGIARTTLVLDSQ